MNEEGQNLHIENDKHNAPYLLAASFHGLVRYVGSIRANGTLYWQFSPRSTSLTLIDKLHSKTEPNIPAKDLFDAIETFWKQVKQTREL